MTAIQNLPGMLGRHPRIVEVYRLVRSAAPRRLPVLVVGETGTGKELVARAVHALGPRSRGPFVDVNCAAVPESLAEGELFGWERGSFTGAERTRLGLLEQANGGTLSLDELCSMSLPLQAKLLRALELQEFRRVGGTQPVSCAFRLVAASRDSTAVMVATGKLREDLAFRIAGLEIAMPPLRRRRSDIGLLARHFLYTVAGSGVTLSSCAVDVLRDHQWPGNIRELRALIERVDALSGEPFINASHVRGCLPNPWRSLSASALRRVLADQGWNISRTARVLRVSRSAFYDRLMALGIKRPDGQDSDHSDVDRVSGRTWSPASAMR